MVNIADIISVSVIFTVAIFHLVIYAERRASRGEKYNLYYCLFTILVGFLITLISFKDWLPWNGALFNLVANIDGSLILFYAYCININLYGISDKRIIRLPYLFLASLSLLNIGIYLTIEQVNAALSIIQKAVFMAATFFLCSWVYFIMFKRRLYKNRYIVLTNLSSLLLALSIMGAYILFAFTIINQIFGAYILVYSIALTFKYNDEFKELQNLKNNLSNEVERKTRQLQLVQEHKTNFFLNFAHEIKTPLTLLINYFRQYIKGRLLTKELAIMQDSIATLLNDVTNLLDSEKFANGKTIYRHLNLIDFSAICRSQAVLFEISAKQKGIGLDWRFEAIPELRIDPHAAVRMVNNLVENAIKYTPKGGEIHLGLTAAQDTVEFSVQDSGIGIPAKHLDSLFTQYYQVESEIHSSHGMGLGLYIVKEIVDSLMGEIKITSVEGQGSKFSILLPTQARAANSVKPLASPIPSSNQTIAWPTQCTVLLVEDNPSLRSLLCDGLGKHCRVTSAENGMDALEKIAAIQEIDLVISDIMMDSMDGFSFLSQFRLIDRHQATPFLFLSAKDNVNDRLQAFEGGAVDFISKPFFMEELLAKSAAIIAQNRQTREITKKAIVDETERITLVRFCEHYQLSEREKAITQKILEGLSDKLIAAELGLETKTVQNYLQRLYRKLRINSRFELLDMIRAKP